MINDKEFKLAWQAGWDAAIGAHAGVVAAAERVIEQWRLKDPPSHAEIHNATVTLASAVDNLKTTLEIGLDRG